MNRKKLMKYAASVFLIGILAFAFAGCGGSDEEANADNAAQSADSAAQSTTEASAELDIFDQEHYLSLMDQVADTEITKSYEEYLEDEAFANAEMFSVDDDKAYVYLNTQEYVILNEKAYSMSGAAGAAILHFTRSQDGIRLDEVEWAADGEEYDKWLEENFSEEALASYKKYEPYESDGHLKLNDELITIAEEALGVPVERENLLEIDPETGAYEIVKTIETGTPEGGDYSFDTETVEKGTLEKL